MGAWSENHPPARVKNLALGWPQLATTDRSSHGPERIRTSSREALWNPWVGSTVLRATSSNPGGAVHRRRSLPADAGDAGTFRRVVRRALRTKKAPAANRSEYLDNAIRL